MNLISDTPISSETLTQDELQHLTGAARKKDQTTWLEENGWVFVKNRGGDPIVGRLYARMMLAGIRPGESNMNSQTPNFSSVR
jgi:Domain of unknown function (DUF4224)